DRSGIAPPRWNRTARHTARGWPSTRSVAPDAPRARDTPAPTGNSLAAPAPPRAAAEEHPDDRASRVCETVHRRSPTRRETEQATSALPCRSSPANNSLRHRGHRPRLSPFPDRPATDGAHRRDDRASGADRDRSTGWLATTPRRSDRAPRENTPPR